MTEEQLQRIGDIHCMQSLQQAGANSLHQQFRILFSSAPSVSSVPPRWV
jgi:hypothetical protein